jgi:hypothetical protein
MSDVGMAGVTSSGALDEDASVRPNRRAQSMTWRTEIRTALTKSHLLVLLFTAPSKHWDWCLYETGYFRALMDKEPDRRLICLHDPNFPVPAPLRGINHVPAIEADVEIGVVCALSAVTVLS